MSYKVNKAIEVTYQAAGAANGLVDVTMVIFDETHTDIAANVTMTEIGSTGRYYGSFTPDAEGEWQVHINSVATPGKVIKQFTVVAHDVDSVGDDIATVDTVVDAIKVVTDVESGVKADVAALNDLSTSDVDARLTAYDVAKASDIVSPPQVG
jgi:hypothetical protein